jgi:CRP/FNR family transcriptional regulator, cyclic AMP receptor protein
MVGLLELTEGLPVRTLDDDEALIEQGAAPGPLYVLESGTLVVERDGTAFATVDTPGAVFGEMAAVLQQPATATCRAQGPCRLRMAEDPIAFLTDNPGAALAALRTASTRLDNLTRYLGDVKRQYAEMSGHMGMVDDVLHVLVHHQPRPVQTGSVRDPDLDY